MTQAGQNIDGVKQARGRRILLVLLGITLLPVAIAWTMYYTGWHPERTGNYGELVTPARPLTDLGFEATDGTARSLAGLRGKWTLLYLAPAACPESCRVTLYQLQQVTLAQGKEGDRIRRVFLAQEAGTRAVVGKVVSEFAATEGWTGEARVVEALRAQLAVPGESAGRVYLIDPLGNLVLTYPAGFDPSGMRKDLGRLLRVSRVG
jgi:cytochrome oxidase Cu insertion factor (SCO1/SenC/PrrC family)